MLQQINYVWTIGLFSLTASYLLLVTSYSMDYRPRYHIVAPEGRWMNDPNGPFYDEKQDIYHLFYQYNPYDYHWGNMSWNHLVSEDLVTWRTLPVALYPDKSYGTCNLNVIPRPLLILHFNAPDFPDFSTLDSNGVFSGSVFRSTEGKLAIYYTCVDSKDVQRQCIAYPLESEDHDSHLDSTGAQIEEEIKNMYVDWVKSPENPLLDPPGLPDQFRDPFVWTEKVFEQERDIYDLRDRMILAAQMESEGLITLYEKDASASITDWRYKSNLWSVDSSPNPDARKVQMVECPDFFPLVPDGDTYSQSMESCEQIYLLKYSLMSTRLDYYELGTYQNSSFLSNGVYGYIDHGAKFAYYASKTFWDNKEQRRILWGWSSETDEDENDTRKWQGVMALPRYVEYDPSSAVVRMNPIAAVEKLRGNVVNVESLWNLDVSKNNEILTYDTGVNSKQIDLTLNANVTAVAADSDFVEIGVMFSACGIQKSGIDYGNKVYTTTGVHFDFANQKVYTHFNTEHSGGTTPREIVKRELPISNLSSEALQSLFENFEIRVFIDHSIAEVFFGNGLAVATVRVYAPTVCDSIGLYTQGRSKSSSPLIVNLRVEAYEMKGGVIIDSA